jgi:hypothetical protein
MLERRYDHSIFAVAVFEHFGRNFGWIFGHWHPRGSSKKSRPTEHIRREGTTIMKTKKNYRLEYLSIGQVTDSFFPQVVLIQPQDTGAKSHPFAHAVVAG